VALVSRQPAVVVVKKPGGAAIFLFLPCVEAPTSVFVSFLVCFCLVLLLLVSGGGGAAGGFQTVRWRLLTGEVAVGGDGGSSPCFLFNSSPSLSCVSSLFCSPPFFLRIVPSLSLALFSLFLFLTLSLSVPFFFSSVFSSLSRSPSSVLLLYFIVFLWLL